MIRFAGALKVLGILVLLAVLAAALGAGGAYLYLAPKLPSAETLRDVRLQVPLRVYTREGELLAEFGEKRRTPLRLDEVPEQLIQAFLAGEDDRFFEHPGVDWQGLTRAVLHLVRTGEKGPGGSTITMQVARNFFLTREKTYIRKLNEILLALKIEREFTKEEILELYVNKIFLGHRAYGVGAAAQVYYGRPVAELDLPRLAMIAGLPKAPSRFNPVTNPEQAVVRRAYVLRRMLEIGYIDREEHDAARDAPVTAKVHGLAVEVEAPYVAEMVRAHMEETYGDDVYTAGYKVRTTIDGRLQRAANAALRQTLLEYDARHGFRGTERHVAAGEQAVPPDKALADDADVGGLVPAVVTSADESTVSAWARGVGPVDVEFEDMDWARPYISENRRGDAPKGADAVLKAGDVIRVRPVEDGWTFAQLPDVEGALVSLDPNDGAIVALTGGFDFYRSKFNRATQAQRQPGSSFKPFIYSAALEHGYTPASIINDAPVVFEDESLKSAWRPENYGGKFHGPTPLRTALYKSRNLVSIRLLREIGLDFALEHIARFGIDVDRLPRGLSLALGSGGLTPLEVATGYGVLANGGYAVEPYYIDRVLDGDDTLVFAADPLVVCRDCDDEEEAAAVSASTDPAAGDPAAADGEDEDSAPALSAEAGTATDTAAPAGTATATGTLAATAANADTGTNAHTGTGSPVVTPGAPRRAPRVLEARNAWLMYSLMRDVIQRGTGRKARVLERDDLAGKTGTTNDQYDAWFSGFSPDLVATAWIGFDEFRPLGRRETGASAALPMWIAYMKEALEGVERRDVSPPEGIVTVRIVPETGELAGTSHEGTVFESFRKERVPTRVAESAAGNETRAETVAEKLF